MMRDALDEMNDLQKQLDAAEAALRRIRNYRTTHPSEGQWVAPLKAIARAYFADTGR